MQERARAFDLFGDKMKNFNKVSITKVRTFWNKRPCNIRHSSFEIGTKEYFNEVEKRKYFVESHIPKFARFNSWRDKNILEIGCGIGTDTINFARAGARVTAVEISSKSISIAKKRAGIFKLKKYIKFFFHDAEKLSEFLPSKTYDLIYSFGVIHHTPNPERLIQQFAYFSHKGTTLKIMVYNRYSWRVIQIILKNGLKIFRGLGNLIAENSEAQTGCPVTYTFSKREIRKLLEQNGFFIKQISINHIFPYDVSLYQKYKYKKIWYFRWMPNLIFRTLEKLIGWHICITAERRKQ